MKDYGEPWSRKPNEINTCPVFFIEDRKGYLIADFNRTEIKQRKLYKRAVDCVNALQGIPTESLPEVKKAWLAMQLWSKFGGFNHTQWFLAAPHMNSRSHGGVPNVHMFNAKYVVINELGIINTALEMREREADFGELNALLDSLPA